MAEIKFPENLPDWFDIDQYEFKPASEEEEYAAILAVLDRIPFYQSIAAFAPPAGVSDTAGKEALAALEEWSANPYQRITSQWKSALQVALQPSVTAGDIAAFEGIVEREEEAERAACQLALTEALEGVQHLPARDKLVAVQEAVQRMLEPGEEEKEWTKPVKPQWSKKLLTYYAAAYMDLAMWAALAGHTLSIRSLHVSFRKDSKQKEIRASITPNEGSVRDFMEALKDEPILPYLARLEKGRE